MDAKQNPSLPALIVGFFFVCFVLINVLAGGTRLVHALPLYTGIGLVALLSVFLLRRRNRAPCIWALASTLCFTGYILVRTILSPVEYLARPDLFMVMASVLVYFIVAFYLTEKHRLWVLLGLFVLACAHVAIGMIQFRDNADFMPITFLQRASYGWRASGFYICPNHLAGFLEVLAMFALSLVCWSTWKGIVKGLIGYCLGVCIFGVVITGSRGGYLSTLFGLVVFVILSALAVRRRAQGGNAAIYAIGLAVLLAGAGIATLLVTKSDFLRERALSTYEPENMRIILWKGALQQFNLSPVVGTGSRTYFYYGRFFQPSRLDRDPEFPHNDYLQLLAEFGAVGAALFLLFLVAHLSRGLRTYRALSQRGAERGMLSNNALALNIGALSALSTYIVHSIFDFNLHIPTNALLIAFVFALLTPRLLRKPGDTQRTFSGNDLFAYALPVAGLCVLFLSIRLLPGEYYTEEARRALNHERYSDAISLGKKAVQFDPRNCDAYRYIGSGYSESAAVEEDEEKQKSQYLEALNAFTKALALFPQDRWLLLEIGWALDGLNRFEEAEPYFKKAIGWDPNSAQAYFYYGAHFEGAGKYDLAEAQFRKSLALAPTDAAKQGLARIEDRRQGRKVDFEMFKTPASAEEKSDSPEAP